MLFNPAPGDPNLPGTYDATSTTEWGVPYSPGEYGYGAYGYGYGYGDPVADPYGYEHSETYGVYGSYGDPGGAGYVNPLNGNQMREQAFQTADGFVYANTGSHLGGGIMSQNGGGGTVDEYGNPVDDYGYGYGAYGYGYGYGTTGLTTEEVTIADALATQKAMQNELHFHNYEDAEGANAPEINGPMTPEANAAGGSLANGGIATGSAASGAAGTLGMGLASGETLTPVLEVEHAVGQATIDYDGELWEEAYSLIDERTQLIKKRNAEDDPTIIQQYNVRIDEINERLDEIAAELSVDAIELNRYYSKRKAAEERISSYYTHFLRFMSGDVDVAWHLAELFLKKRFPKAWKTLSSYPEKDKAAVLQMSIAFDFNPNNIPRERIEGMVKRGEAKKYVINGTEYWVVYTPLGKFVLKNKVTVHDDNYVDTDLTLRPPFDSSKRIEQIQLVTVVNATDKWINKEDNVDSRNRSILVAIDVGPRELKKLLAREEGLSLVAGFVPGVATIDNYIQEKYDEAFISLLGDAAMLAGGVGAAMKWTGTARKIVIAADITVEMGVGTYRSYQAIQEYNAGNGGGAAMKTGETLLRLFGASASSIQLFKLRAKANPTAEAVGELVEFTDEDALRISRISDLRRLLKADNLPDSVRYEATKELALLKRGYPISEESLAIDANSIYALLERQDTELSRELLASLKSGDFKITLVEGKIPHPKSQKRATGLYIGRDEGAFVKTDGRTSYQVLGTIAHEYRHHKHTDLGYKWPNTQWQEFRAARWGRDVLDWNDPLVVKLFGKRPSDAELWDFVKTKYPTLELGDPLPN